MSKAAQLYHGFIYVSALGVFFLGSICFNALCLAGLLLGLARPLRGFYRWTLRRLFKFWLWLIQALGLVRIDAKDLDRLRTDRGVIYISNHPTILDAPMLAAIAPEVICIYKESLRRHPFYGAIAQAVGYLPNTGGPDMIRNAAEALSAGANLVIFPDGTRSATIRTDSWKGGFALIAKRSGAPIRSLWIESPPGFLDSKGTLWESIRTVPAIIRVEAFDERRLAARASLSDAMNDIARSFEARQSVMRA